MDMRKEMMNRQRSLTIKSHISFSLPADSSWFIFFTKAFFGRNFLNLNGRACRKEWWVVTIMSLVLAIIAAFIYAYAAITFFDFSLDTAGIEELNLFLNGGSLINIILSVPAMAVSFRRFHDLDMSAWQSCLIIPNFMLPFVKGKPQDNRFGENIY